MAEHFSIVASRKISKKTVKLAERVATMSELERLVVENQSQHEIILYKKRWFVALLVGMQMMCVRFLQNSIGIVNDVYVKYFKVSYIAVDWFTIIQLPGSVVANLIAAFLIFRGTVGLRRLSVSVGAMTVLAYSAMLISSIVPIVYPMIYVGQFLMGVAYSTINIMIIQMANIWFPENEVGKALTVLSISTACASILGYLVPSHVLKQVSNIRHTQNLSSVNNNLPKYDWFFENQKIFMIYYGILIAIAIMLLCLVIKVVEDKPPKPPSKVQARIRNIEIAEHALNINHHNPLLLRSFLQDFKRVLTNHVFVLAVIVDSIRSASIDVYNIFFSELLRPVNLKAFPNVAPNMLSGYMLATYDSAVIFGSLIAAYVFDRFQKHMLQLSLSTVFMFVVVLGTLCGIYYENMAVAWTFTGLKGLALVFGFAAMKDILVQHMYLFKPGFISALQTLVGFVGSAIIAQSSRFVLNYGGNLGVFVFISTLLFVACVLCCFLKPDLKRTQNNS